jgi:hypothetical protein
LFKIRNLLIIRKQNKVNMKSDIPNVTYGWEFNWWNSPTGWEGPIHYGKSITEAVNKYFDKRYVTLKEVTETTFTIVGPRISGGIRVVGYRKVQMP